MLLNTTSLFGKVYVQRVLILYVRYTRSGRQWSHVAIYCHGDESGVYKLSCIDTTYIFLGWLECALLWFFIFNFLFHRVLWDWGVICFEYCLDTFTKSTRFNNVELFINFFFVKKYLVNSWKNVPYIERKKKFFWIQIDIVI